MKRARLALSIASVFVAVCAARANNIDESFRKFWEARNPQDASKAADRVVKSGVTFDAALARLKAGRPYAKDVPIGAIRGSRRTGDGEFAYVVHVPSDYDPARRYQVRVFLHGGVMRPDPPARGDGPIPLEGANQIYVLPTAWPEAPWWNDVQIDNIEAILDSLKRTYNVDENRVALAGVSDGGTGLYYLAMRDTTPFASFLPLNGYLMVLTNVGLLHSEVYPQNLVNKPFFVVNGGRDPLYPIRVVEPYIRHLQRSGVEIQYMPQADAGHNTQWWPLVKDSFEGFVREHPRQPLPYALTWESALDGSRGGRAHWLVIDKLASRVENAPSLSDANDAANGQLFEHDRRSGRVDLLRTGNRVEATTRGVAEFRLLLSPDAFDFSKPVKVTVNGSVAFEGLIKTSVATLLEWAARDNDRTMLFGAELRIKVP